MFTGERILAGGKYHVTHQQSLFAYEWTRQRAMGKDVLDVGSGEGYGVAHLAQSARRVVGLDAHEPTVRQARQRYAAVPRAEFITGTLDQPPPELAGQTFDVVCSFQTIEHIVDQDGFLEAMKKFTAPSGTVIVTTPNKGRFPGFNPYHVRELTPRELQELMERHFEDVEIWGVFGDEAVLRYREGKQRVSEAFLRLDVLRAREWLPRPVVLGLYAVGAGLVKSLSWRTTVSTASSVSLSSFSLDRDNLSRALDLLAVGTVASHHGRE